jgi:outer membrane protein OmpA-like peptidoglycan-associated protein
MNRQSQWLFEVPVASQATLYTNLYSNPEWESEWELAETFPLNEEEWETVGRLKVPRRSMPPRSRGTQVPRSGSSSCPPVSTQPRIVNGWTQYRRQVRELPPDQQAKLRQLSNDIRMSYRPGCQPVRKVQIHGHADVDTPPNPKREKQMSDERARMVRDWLQKDVGSSIAAQINWKETQGFGATKLRAQPITEENRRQNRRVEIFLMMSRNGKLPCCSCPPMKSRNFTTWLQRSLSQILGLRLPINGKFDAQTKKALQNFQSMSRLPVTGIFDHRTLQAMWSSGAANSPCNAGTQIVEPMPAEIHEEVDLVLSNWSIYCQTPVTFNEVVAQNLLNCPLPAAIAALAHTKRFSNTITILEVQKCTLSIRPRRCGPTNKIPCPPPYYGNVNLDFTERCFQVSFPTQKQPGEKPIETTNFFYVHSSSSPTGPKSTSFDPLYGHSPGNCLWFSIVEKAYAIWRGGIPNGYEALDNFKDPKPVMIDAWGSLDYEFRMDTNPRSVYRRGKGPLPVNFDATLQQVLNNAGRNPTTAGTSENPLEKLGLVGLHAYTVLGFNSNSQSVKLYNPSNNGTVLSILYPEFIQAFTVVYSAP